MTSAESGVLEPPNSKIFWGRTPLQGCAFMTRDNNPPYVTKNLTYGPANNIFLISNTLNIHKYVDWNMWFSEKLLTVTTTSQKPQLFFKLPPY